MKTVKRAEDMSVEGFLQVSQDEDGDIYVTVCEHDNGMKMPPVSVEFCIPGTGGGHSPRTHAALLALMAAMEADDDAERPCPGAVARTPASTEPVTEDGREPAHWDAKRHGHDW